MMMDDFSSLLSDSIKAVAMNFWLTFSHLIIPGVWSYQAP